MGKHRKIDSAALFVEKALWGCRRQPGEKTLLDADALAWLKSNRVGVRQMLRLRPELEAQLRPTAEVESCVLKETEITDRNSRTYLEVNEALNQQGIKTILIKSVGFFPGETSNIDILVPENASKEGGHVLERLGYFRQKRYLRPDKFLWGRFHGDQKRELVHLHTRVSWGPPFVDVGSLWRNRIALPEYGFRPSNEQGFLITIASKFYEDSKFDLLDIIKLHLCKRQELNWKLMEEEATNFGWLSGYSLSSIILDACSKHLFPEHDLLPEELRAKYQKNLSFWDGSVQYYGRLKPNLARCALPLALNKVFTKSHAYLASLRSRSTPVVYKVRDMRLLSKWACESLLGVRDRRRFLLTLSGPDGAGKSTLAASAERALMSTAETPKVIWVRIGDSAVLNCLKSAYRCATLAKPAREVSTGSTEGLLKGNAIQRCWLLLASTDYIIRVWIMVGWPLARSRVVICDRYVPDALNDLAHRCGCEQVYGSKWEKMLRFLCPRPDLEYLVLAEPSTIQKRRDLQSPATILESIRNYERNMPGITKMITIRTDTGDLRQLTSFATHVAKTYYAKY